MKLQKLQTQCPLRLIDAFMISNCCIPVPLISSKISKQQLQTAVPLNHRIPTTVAPRLTLALSAIGGAVAHLPGDALGRVRGGRVRG